MGKLAVMPTPKLGHVKKDKFKDFLQEAGIDQNMGANVNNIGFGWDARNKQIAVFIKNRLIKHISTQIWSKYAVSVA